MGLEVNELFKQYGGKTVVDHLSFRMDEPGVYALLGTNGAGKTTSIRMMLDILAKDGGTAIWNGKPLSVNTCNIGYLAEERGLYPKYALMDQLVYFAELRGVSKADAKKRISHWSKRLELDEYLYPEQHKQSQLQTPARRGMFAGSKKEKPKLADQLSKGNQQKIQFLAALLSDPELIVLDEPLSGLDPVNTDLIKNVIREEIAEGKYLIMSSHQMATVEEFCTDITILHRSKAVLQGNLNEIKKGYGRVRLHVKTEQDITRYLQEAGIAVMSEKEYEYELRVTGEEQANALLFRLMNDHVTIITFDLREPSLHEIFVEKAGEADERE